MSEYDIKKLSLHESKQKPLKGDIWNDVIVNQAEFHCKF